MLLTRMFATGCYAEVVDDFTGGYVVDIRLDHAFDESTRGL